jgi:hypothetical protein
VRDSTLASYNITKINLKYILRLRILGFTVRIKIGRYEMVSSSLLGLLLLLVILLHVLLVKEKNLHIKNAKNRARKKRIS